jgi:hypothetical protein
MKHIYILFGILIFLFLAVYLFLNRYEIESADHAVYRLDRLTGEVLWINRLQIIRPR